MIDNDEFREWGHKFVDWIADYYQTVDQYPVKSQARPGEILRSIPATLPETSESMASIWSDFQSNIMPGMTHWQHPGFMAYFPANTSFPSILAEMLTAGLGAQCMIWDTSPAAAELEERMMQWLGQLLGIPATWSGTIQSTASEATLSAILSAREQVTDFAVNDRGLQGHPHLRIYASKQIHSSIEKAVKIAGLGKENFVAIPTDSDFAMDLEQLEEAILRDQNGGNVPTCIIVGLGTTGSTAVDPLKQIVALAQKHQIWVHIDAAYAGTAMMLQEYRHMIEGIELADSFVVNPHKWMMVNFDCSCYFVKDKSALVRTFEILPEYLKTDADQQVNNYRDWGIPLGRRFRALKLWFVMRNFGADQIRQTIRNHITWAQEIADEIRHHKDFELLAPVPFNLICFRFAPSGMNHQELNRLNQAIVERIKSSESLYVTHTVLSGIYTIRLVAGQTYMKRENLQFAWAFIQKLAKEVYQEPLPS